MKKYLLTGAIIALSIAPQVYSKCGGESGYTFTNYRNRNPQTGGFISNNAYVDDSSNTIFIGPNVSVCGSSNISGSVKLYGSVVIKGAKISGNAEISENASVEKGAEVSGKAKMKGHSTASGSVSIYGNAVLAGNAKVYNISEDFLVEIFENARITGDAEISEDSLVHGRSRVQGNTILKGDVEVMGRSSLKGYVRLDSGVHDSLRKNVVELPYDERVALAYIKREKLKKLREVNARRKKEQDKNAKRKKDYTNAVQKIKGNLKNIFTTKYRTEEKIYNFTSKMWIDNENECVIHLFTEEFSREIYDYNDTMTSSSSSKFHTNKIRKIYTDEIFFNEDVALFEGMLQGEVTARSSTSRFKFRENKLSDEDIKKVFDQFKIIKKYCDEK